MKTKILFAPGLFQISTVVLLLAVFLLDSACGQETLHSFQGLPGGITLIQGSDGNFYGTIYSGGDNNLGAVFKMTADGTVTNLVSFNGTNGANPGGRLTQGSDGNFYGTTANGGKNDRGTVFKMTPGGTLTTLVTFNAANGGIPYATLIQGSDGNFYGTTYWGGNLALGGGSGYGTVFRMTPSGILTTLVKFSGDNGANPYAGVIQGADGNFYGTTQWGGTAASLGTVFKMTSAGTLTTLAFFNGANGGHPGARLVQGSDGNFYGTTQWGGLSSLNGGGGFGTVFKITPGGVLTTIAAFNGTNGAHPFTSLMQANDGYLYGTTYGGGDLPVSSGNSYGTVFRTTTNGNVTTLVSFTVDNGAYPFDGVIQATDGNFYGTTGDGPTGGHTIFRFNTSQPLSFTQQPGDRSASINGDALFQSVALGEAPLGYQWYFNGTAITDATNSNLAIANAQPSNAGNYLVVATNISGSITSLVATLQVNLTQFAQVTTGAPVTDLGNYTRGVWGDFNNDGFLDLFVSGYTETNFYYLSNGNGTFTKVTSGDPVQDADYHTGAAAADYDNDGNLDLMVSAGVGDSTPTHNILYHGNGDGTFTRANGGFLTTKPGYFDACAWADYNNDGFVDLFITDSGVNSGGSTNLLFRNNGNGTFFLFTSGDVARDFGNGYGTAWADYDNDGFMDLIVVNNTPSQNNFLYHNNRNGTFTRILTNDIATDMWENGAQCAAWGDYDNDGLPDLFITDNGGTRNHLYHNNGNGSFTNVTSGPEFTPSPGSNWSGCSWGDYDNDGYLDLFVCGNGGVNALYHNNGDGTFTQITNEPVVNGGGPDFDCQSVAWVDYDNDGSLDLFLSRYNANTLTFNLLFHNNGNTNGWMEVKLAGADSNRSAIGAKVRIKATIRGKTFWQMREITSGGGWNLQPLIAHFGVGDATSIDTLRIEWPSGSVQEFHDVLPNQILTITESPHLTVSVTNGTPELSFKGVRGTIYEIESSTNLTTWSAIDIVTATNINSATSIIDTNEPLAGRFYRVRSLSGGVTGDDYDLETARDPYNSPATRIKAAQGYAEFYFFLVAQAGHFIPSSFVEEALSIAYDLDPTDPTTLADMAELQYLKYLYYGP
ncbi:MAG TPA: choice-of-anchor tandem repeat GloVer-containing protein [Pseudomonadales bacterium]|nr:choice-of-anchor tandem repeat GloVer-containing protein [Pseudomonadales bacterium]